MQSGSQPKLITRLGTEGSGTTDQSAAPDHYGESFDSQGEPLAFLQSGLSIPQAMYACS
jgi:hypothetical protein